MPPRLSDIIGDYVTFHDRVLRQACAAGLDATGMAISHLCYRVQTDDGYRDTLAALRDHASELTENDFNGRPVALIALRDPPLLGAHPFTIVELPAPRAAHTYPTGLEHVGFVVPGDFARFIERHSAALSGIKDRGADFKPAFRTFADGSTAKFYPRPLRDVVESEGGVFKPVA